MDFQQKICQTETQYLPANSGRPYGLYWVPNWHSALLEAFKQMVKQIDLSGLWNNRFLNTMISNLTIGLNYLHPVGWAMVLPSKGKAIEISADHHARSVRELIPRIGLFNHSYILTKVIAHICKTEKTTSGHELELHDRTLLIEHVDRSS